MLLQRLDDYQTWLLTHGSTALLIDPWLSATTLREVSIETTSIIL